MLLLEVKLLIRCVRSFKNVIECLFKNIFCCFSGISSDWYPNLDCLKESCRIATSYNWADVDLSPFQGCTLTHNRPYFILGSIPADKKKSYILCHHKESQSNVFNVLWSTVIIPPLWALTFEKYPLSLLSLTNKKHCPASETLPLFLVTHTQTRTHRLSNTLPNCLMWIIQLGLDSLTAHYRGQCTKPHTDIEEGWSCNTGCCCCWLFLFLLFYFCRVCNALLPFTPPSSTVCGSPPNSRLQSFCHPQTERASM